MGSYLPTTTADGLDVDNDTDYSICTEVIVDDDSPIISAAPELSINLPHDGAISVLVANAINELIICEDTPGAKGTRNIANFEDLPVEILMMIAEILLARYITSSDEHIVYSKNHDVDLSFFTARRINLAMEIATREAFLDPALPVFGEERV